MRIFLLFLFISLIHGQSISLLKKQKTDLITSTISESMEFIATVDKTKIQVRNIESEKLINSLTGFASPLTIIRFHPNNRLLLGGTESGILYIWNIHNGQLIVTLKPHNDAITDIILHPREPWIITSSNDKKIKIHNEHTKELIHSLSEHTNFVNDIDLHIKSDQLASASDDGTLIIWDLNKGKLRHKFKRKNRLFSQVYFNHNKNKLLSVTRSGIIHKWNTNSKKATSTFKTKKDNSVISFPSAVKGKIIIGYQTENKIDFVNTKNWKVEKSYDTKRQFKELHYVMDNLQLYTVHNKNVRLWDADYIFTDQQKIENYLNNKLRAWYVVLDGEKKKQYKKRTSKKNTKKKLDKWFKEAIDYFGEKKYKVLQEETIQIEHDEKSNIVRVFGTNLQPLYFILKKNEIKKFRKNFEKMKIRNKKYVFSNDQIILKSATFSSGLFPRKLNYQYEKSFEFKGLKISNKLEINKLKLKF